MKSFYLCLLLVLCFRLNAQNKEMTISGRVTGSKYKKAVPYAPVRLHCNDNSLLDTYTDSAGYYSLKKIIHTNTAAILEASAPDKKLFGLCPYSFKNTVYYFPTKSKLVLSIDSISGSIIQDIELTEGDIDYEFPHTVYFKTNSLDFSLQQENFYATDTAMDCVVDYLQNNPKAFLTISGYVDRSEQNKQELSEQHATLIYDLLIKKGIDKKRLCHVGKGDRVPVRNQEFELDRTIQLNSKVELQVSRMACVPKSIK